MALDQIVMSRSRNISSPVLLVRSGRRRYKCQPLLFPLKLVAEHISIYDKPRNVKRTGEWANIDESQSQTTERVT